MKQRFRRVTYPLETFNNIKDATEFIEKQKVNGTSVFLITSGKLGSQLVEHVFNNPYVLQIYIFCGYKPAHIEWSLPYIIKLKLFDFDAELLISLTHDIARHLADMAKNLEVQDELVRAAGLLDWATWLYHDAFLNEQTYYRSILDNIGQKRQKLNEKHKKTFLNQFNT